MINTFCNRCVNYCRCYIFITMYIFLYLLKWTVVTLDNKEKFNIKAMFITV